MAEAQRIARTLVRLGLPAPVMQSFDALRPSRCGPSPVTRSAESPNEMSNRNGAAAAQAAIQRFIGGRFNKDVLRNLVIESSVGEDGDAVERIPNVRSGCRSFLDPSPWRDVFLSEHGTVLTRGLRIFPGDSAYSGVAPGRIAIGAQPLTRHSRFLAFFYSIEIVSAGVLVSRSLAIGVTLTSPENIKDSIRKGESLPKTANKVPGTFIVGLRRRMFSPTWCGKSKTYRWSGPQLRTGPQGGCVITLAVGLNGRMYIFVDGNHVDIKCPSGVPLRGCVSVYPIVELSGEAIQVMLAPDAKLPHDVASTMEQLEYGEPLSDQEDSSSFASSETDSSGDVEGPIRRYPSSSSGFSSASSDDSSEIGWRLVADD
ncbi:hypothetical protein FOZ61_009563 [Perkinsus olseni]|nr:hypothetical protein FOZ61_009563 [Perkinsus olseni]KAF4654649.1 hypothetical protein FOL46_008652 [Perkinsus olseni]